MLFFVNRKKKIYKKVLKLKKKLILQYNMNLNLKSLVRIKKKFFFKTQKKYSNKKSISFHVL